MYLAKKSILFLVALALLAPLDLPAQSLGRRLDARLDGPGLDRHLWGVAVTDLSGKLLYGRNADRLFVPASNTKLLVTAAALVMLGPEFTVNTSLYGAGPVEHGVLRGDLVLYGRGDPTFSDRCYDVDTSRAGACDHDPSARFRDMARQLVQRGIREVDGNLIGDGSYFDEQLVHPAWEVYDLGWWYAAPVSGLMYNDNALDIRVSVGDTPGGAPQLVMNPELEFARLENRAVVGERDSSRTFDIFRTADGSRYLATGVVPAGRADQTLHPAVLDPNHFAALALRRELLAMGIVVRGEVRSTLDPRSTAHARSAPALAEVTSRPLRDWLFPILNSSQNLFAEMLLKQLGRELGGTGSWSEGRRAERRFLIDSVGIDSTAFSPEDGSGLSAGNLVTPRAFTQLLGWMRKHPSYPHFAAALPRSGALGSLLRRFVGTPLEGRVVAKTGTINRVNALSGYVERADGRVMIFSVQANHHTIGSAGMLPAIDSIVAELGKR